MIYIVQWLALAAFLFVATFALFVAIVKMREIQDVIFTLHWSVRWVCYLILAVGLVFDTALNWTVLTAVFFELPQEFLSTARVVRHKHHSTGWRQARALWFCKNWLVPFDPAHCG